MENTVKNPQDHSGDEAKPSQTPHQLYNHHLQHPDEPITDEDIRNLKIDSGAVYEDHQLTDDEIIANAADDKERRERDVDNEEDSTDSERPKASPYDILGG